MKHLVTFRDFLYRLFSKRLTRVIVTLFPFLFGILATFYVQNFLQPVPILAFRVDIGMAALVFGIIPEPRAWGLFLRG